jgi:hypothetical protein
VNELPTIRAYRIGNTSSPLFKPYVYGGDIPLEKDPEVAKSYLHGTASAARLHYLRGENRCDECTEFERARGRARAEARRKKYQAEKEASA